MIMMMMMTVTTATATVTTTTATATATVSQGPDKNEQTHKWLFIIISSSIMDHPRSGVVYNFGRVCMSVCQTITFENLEVGSSFMHIRYRPTSRGYGSSSFMKVNGSRPRSQEQNGPKSLLLQLKTSIGNNPSSIEHRNMKFGCSVRF